MLLVYLLSLLLLFLNVVLESGLTLKYGNVCLLIEEVFFWIFLFVSLFFWIFFLFISISFIFLFFFFSGGSVYLVVASGCIFRSFLFPFFFFFTIVHCYSYVYECDYYYYYYIVVHVYSYFDVFVVFGKEWPLLFCVLMKLF